MGISMHEGVSRALEANRAAYEAVRAGLRVGMTEKEAYALVAAAVDRVCGGEDHEFIGDFVGGDALINTSYITTESGTEPVESIAEGIVEIKSDIKNVKEDVQALRERMAKVEASAASAHKRIDTVVGQEKDR